MCWIYAFRIFALSNPTAFVGMFAASIAVIGIRLQRKTSRDKNSLDFQTTYKKSDQVSKAWDDVMSIYANRLQVPIAQWGEKKYSDTPEAKSLQIIFNEWERCANAIHHKIYDSNYLYKIYGSTLIFLDINFDPYIKERQKINPRFYYSFKKLALEWRVKRAKEDKHLKNNERKTLKEAEKAVNRLKVKY